MSWDFLSYSSIASVTDALIVSLSEACDRITSVGELPGRSPGVKEIRLLAVPKAAEDSETVALFWGKLSEKLQLLQNQGTVIHLGKDQYQFLYEGNAYPFKLMLSTEAAWIANLFQASCGRDLYIAIATAAKNKGLKWIPERGGFEEVATGALLVVTSEEEIFETARLPSVPPEKRYRWLEFAMRESGLPPILTKEQMRAWAGSVVWTDTACGGEEHQYTFRKAGDERDFVHVAECIREIGYDGKYLARKWRYLDLDDHFYFTCGATIETTSLINRKRLQHPPKPWTKNAAPWIPLTQPKQSAWRFQAATNEEQLKLWDFAARKSPLAIQGATQ